MVKFAPVLGALLILPMCGGGGGGSGNSGGSFHTPSGYEACYKTGAGYHNCRNKHTDQWHLFDDNGNSAD